MTTRDIARPAASGFVAVLQLALCAIGIAAGAYLAQIGWGSRWLSLPEWQALLAQIGFVALMGAALWQLVLATHHQAVRRVLLGMAALLGTLLFVAGALYVSSGYSGVLLMIGFAWLVIIWRTWPRAAFRGPRLRDSTFEPQRRRPR